MKNNKFSYLFSDISEDIFEEEVDKEVFEEFESKEINFLDEFFENKEYLCTYHGYLTDAEYLRKYYGLVTN